jgi:hypothetical protein
VAFLEQHRKWPQEIQINPAELLHTHTVYHRYALDI